MDKDPKDMTKAELQAELEKARAQAAEAQKPKIQTKEGRVVFATIETGYNKQLIVRRDFYKERENLGIQQLWRKDENQNWEFGKGVTFDYENIEEIIEGLQKMKSWCEEHPGKEKTSNAGEEDI